MISDEAWLRDTAPQALAMASEHCVDCGWYHGPWPYFRRLGVVSTAAVHEDFLTGHIRDLACERPALQVLVSGTTDHAMLAMVLDACGSRSAAITVADICPTPLALCRRYAEARGTGIDTFCGNILEFPAEQRFDLICTHAFMGYFDDTERARLIRRWYGLLRPGGSVVTVQRLRENHPPGLARFSPGQAGAFRAQVLQAARDRQDEFDMPAAQLADYAAEFAARFVSHPVRSRTDLRHMFVDAGFALPVFAIHDVGHKAAGAVSGPSVPAQAEYVHIMATRT